MINKTNTKLSSSTYLLSCDLINKYNLLTIYKEPKISKIVLSISIKEIENVSYDFGDEENVSSDFQAKTFFFFYLLFGSSPYILFEEFDIIKDTRSKEEGEFTLKATINNPNRVSSFLSNLSMENNFLAQTPEFELFRSAFQSKIQKDHLKGSFNIKIPANFFFDVNLFFSHEVDDINLSKVKLNASFVCENFPKDKKIKNIIENIFFFH